MSLSIPSANITDGVYKIFNVAYPNQVADLLNPGGAKGTIGGFEDNDSSKRNQWEVTNGQAFGFITLTNQAITTYAYADDTTLNPPLVGNPDVMMVWTVSATDAEDEFLILSESAPIAWTLADGSGGTPITMEPISVPPKDDQFWKFLPMN